MKKSLIWTTAGIAAIGFGVPAFAAHNDDAPRPVLPAQVITVTTPAYAATPTNSIDSSSVTTPSTPRSSTSTPDSVEDISGPCDEAEHVNDPRCTAGGDTSGNDGRGDDSGRGRDGGGDNSARHGRYDG